MENLIISKTESTPEVILDCTKHYIEFNGDSRPENVKQFFEPILDWINNYITFLRTTNATANVDVNFKLEYFNSSSAKYIIDLIRIFHQMGSENPKTVAKLNWCHDADDEDMLDTGTEFVKITGIAMNFVSL